MFDEIQLMKLIKNNEFSNYYNQKDPIPKIKIENFRKFYNTIIKYFESNNDMRSEILKTQRNIIVKKKKIQNQNNESENYRYIIQYSYLIRVIDKIFYSSIKNLIPINTDIMIYLANNLSEISNKNALDSNNSVYMDLKSAFDSVEYHILEKILYDNLTIKNIPNAKEIINFYLHLLLNSKISTGYYKFDKTKGIPMGLSSSTLIFTLFIEEIIEKWMLINDFRNHNDFEIVIYIDDIYIKFINMNIINKAINSLIIFLEKHLLYLNLKKCFYGNNLNLEKYGFKPLTYSNEYLGIPIKITNKELYIEWFVNNYKTKHNRNYIDDLKIVINTNDKILKSKVYGFTRYKLYRFIKDINNENLKEFFDIN